MLSDSNLQSRTRGSLIAVLLFAVLAVFASTADIQRGAIAVDKSPNDEREYRALVLDNGMQVLLVSDPETVRAAAAVNVAAGSNSDPAEFNGLAHFLEHMVFKGSEQLDAGEFDLKVEALGGNSNAATGFDDVHYHVLIPPQAAPEALDLLLDLVLQPRLDGSDFAMERQVVLEELAQSEDQPEEVAFQELLRQACGSHAYGLPILGRREALEAHTPEAMAAFHRRHYRADRCCLSVAGPLAGLELETHLNQSPLAALKPSEPLAAVPELQLKPGRDRIELARLEAARDAAAMGVTFGSLICNASGGGLLAGVAVAFPLSLLAVAKLWFRFFQPPKPSADKGAVYECGIAATGDSWIKFKAHYYLYAILFLIFDVEVLFLLPFAVAFTELPVGALVAMLVFILLLAEGLVWAWHRGHLEWK